MVFLFSAIQSNVSTYIMKVVNTPEYSLNPDPTGTKLSYNLQPTKYELHVGEKGDNLYKFVYQWVEGGRTFLTSPYNFKNMQTDGNIPCASSVDISRALTDRNPIQAIIKELDNLIGSGQNLKGSNFIWIMGSALRVAFTLHTKFYSHSLYWKEIDEKPEGDVQMTQDSAEQLILELVQVQQCS